MKKQSKNQTVEVTEPQPIDFPQANEQMGSFVKAINWLMGKVGKVRGETYTLKGRVRSKGQLDIEVPKTLSGLLESIEACQMVGDNRTPELVLIESFNKHTMKHETASLAERLYCYEAGGSEDEVEKWRIENKGERVDGATPKDWVRVCNGKWALRPDCKGSLPNYTDTLVEMGGLDDEKMQQILNAIPFPGPIGTGSKESKVAKAHKVDLSNVKREVTVKALKVMIAMGGKQEGLENYLRDQGYNEVGISELIEEARA